MSWFLLDRNLKLLEPYDWKLSRTVLRGERGSNAPDLPGKAIAKEGMASYIKYLFKTVRKFFGEAVVVTLKVNADDLASYDEAASAWVVTPGNYKFLVGASSRDIKATLEAEVAAATQKTNNILKLQEPMSLLKR